ncbi:DUF6789 family protein [uncultured Rhodospira sp.]|uniref:DUF6789 family protein n=1 Tax=uncultured Rhodospira sp. TaxID=1936189 RepID=UPI0026306B1E|nr:DUF6789 family protein [uncultured Rhodospira sp.]
MMTHIGRGLVAGIVATLALSILMMIKAMAGLLPAVNAIELLTRIGYSWVGLPASPIVGWLMHIMVGVVAWGGLFALLQPYLPGAADWARGMVFSVAGWLLMMLVVMPMAGTGLFGLSIGIAPAIATLVLHLIFGAILGGVFGALAPQPTYHGDREAHAYG